MDRYAGLFQAAYPHAEQRRAFLHYQIKSAHISAANLRLAHLVSSGKIANLVVTTNFDELLSKALRLFRRDVIVCDHPKTTRRIDAERNDPQIVHVHGTHWFYDCCNLNGEIELRAADDQDSNDSMRHLLDRILSHRSPLVIGYSGWEKDVVMTALRRRLRQEPLRHNLYWFCFDQAEPTRLPPWLTEHENVRFVVPGNVPQVKGSPPRNIIPGALSQAADAADSPASGAANTKPQKNTLPARQVFDALVRELQLEEPELTKDPLDFFEKFLTALVSPDESDEDDTYLIKSVIRRVKDGADLVRRESEQNPAAAQQAKLLLEVSGAVRRAAYTDAATLAKSINIEKLLKSQISDLDSALEAICRGTLAADTKTRRENSEVLLDCADIWIRLCETALSRTEPADLHWNTRWGLAKNSKGNAQRSANKTADAIATYNDVIQKLSKTSEPSLRERAAQALFNKGRALSEAKQYTEAIAAYDEFLEKFNNNEDPNIKNRIAGVLFQKGAAIEESGNRTDATIIYDEVVSRFEHATNPDVKEAVILALFRSGYCLQANNHPGCIEKYNNLIAQINTTENSRFDILLALTMGNKALAFTQSGDQQNCISTCNDYLQRFGNSTDPQTKLTTAKVLYTKGTGLFRNGQITESIAIYDEVIQHSNDSTDPELKALSTQAAIDRAAAVERNK
nr:tetratricopeptide repeat protein [Corallococcus sp. NCSPR001]